MKKIIILLIVLLCSGCSVEYNLYTTNTNNLIEEITIYNNYTGSEYFPAFYGSPGTSEENVKIEGVEYYEQIGNTYKFTFDKDNIEQSNAINNCYNIFEVTEDNGIYTLSTSNNNKCFSNLPNLEDITINIYDEFDKIISANTNKIDNTYTWVINNDNRYDSYIEIKLDYSTIDENYQYESSQNTETENNDIVNQENEDNIIIGVIITITFVTGLMSVFIYKIKYNNKGI